MTSQQAADLIGVLYGMNLTMIWLGMSACILAIVVAFK